MRAARDVACPVCGMPAGKPCVFVRDQDRLGKTMYAPKHHKARLDYARRDWPEIARATDALRADHNYHVRAYRRALAAGAVFSGKKP